GQVIKLTASDAAQGDSFGYSVAIDLDTVVVGAYAHNSATGATYIFERNRGGSETWGQVQELTASDAHQSDGFVISVGSRGDAAVAGRYNRNFASGAAYIFGRNQGGAENWGQVQELTASDAAQSAQFGASVRINNDTAVVGGYGHNSFTGATYIFERNQGGAEKWGQVQELTASDAAQHDEFGVSGGGSEDTALVVA